jgi:hypothetical protein
VNSSSERCALCPRLKKICQCVAIVGMAFVAPLGHDHGHEPDRAPGPPSGKLQVTVISTASVSSTGGSSIDYRTLGWSLSTYAPRPRRPFS